MEITASNTDESVLRELGHRLARLRLERNRTQSQLAKEAGLGKSTLEKLESGQAVSLRVFIRVLRALGLLEGLDRFLPEPTPSPLELLELAGRRRKRASRDRPRPAAASPPQPWRWGEDPVGADS